MFGGSVCLARELLERLKRKIMKVVDLDFTHLQQAGIEEIFKDLYISSKKHKILLLLFFLESFPIA